jgi:predicted DNA-binding WGR domain protein
MPATDRYVRLEYTDNTSNKFYEIVLKTDENNFHVVAQWGKISYNPNARTYYSGTSETKAFSAFNELRIAKVRKGYKVKIDLQGAEATAKNTSKGKAISTVEKTKESIAEYNEEKEHAKSRWSLDIE